jgi:hypothetical protein
MRVAAWVFGIALAVGIHDSASAGITLKTPKTRQIVQRNPSNLGSFTINGDVSALTNLDRIEARFVVMPGSTNNGVSTDWVVLVRAATNGAFTGTMTNIAAGGWYRLEVRALDAGTNELASVSVDRLGVGDIIVTAGQSNAACFGLPKQVPKDDRVSSYLLGAQSWKFANDPQPDNSGGMGGEGSPWPILGSLLISSNHVPVGFVCVAYGGTAVSQWAPGTSLYRNLTNALRFFGPNGVRAVLWHQGESDAAATPPTTAAAYSKMLSNIVVQSRASAGWSVPWGIAEAAYIGGTLAGQEAVMAGQRVCIYSVPNCFRGPRTEDFHLEGKLSDVVHFNGAGLAEHAQMWANALLGIEDLTVKNGDFESNVALLDGRISPAIQVIGWNRLNATGDRTTGGYSGYMNPADSTYLNCGDTNSGGVLPHMNGRHVATLYGLAASSPPGDAFLQTLRAHLQPSTIYTLQAAIGLRNGNAHGGYGLDLLTNGVPMGAGVTGDASTLNQLAGGNATNTFTVVSCVITSAVSVPPNQQLAIRITKTNGGATYLDFDDVRLTGQLTDYGRWQMTNWHSLTASNSLPDADPDGDVVSNWQEWLDGSDPNNPLSSRPVIRVQPAGLLTLAGSDVSFNVAATGTTPLTYYWHFNETNLIAVGTHALLTVRNVQPAEAGLYSVAVSNFYAVVVSSAARLRVDHPPVADASATKAVVVSANGTNANVILNGSRSRDADNDPLQYSWFEGNTLLASGAVAVRSLFLGSHPISLVVSDGMFVGTNGITVEVLTPAHAVQRLMALCDAKAPRPQPLRATLSAALASINRGDSTPAVKQLGAFQNKVSAQVSPLDPPSAVSLLQGSQDVIDVLGGRTAHGRPAITAVHHRAGGKAHLQIMADPRRTYVVQASSNLLDWEMVGVLKVEEDGSAAFDDPQTNRFTQRFYRLIGTP